MQNQIESILSKEMDRKEFLKLVGFGVASVAGISAIGNVLNSATKGADKSSKSYGSSAYGGYSSPKEAK